MTYSIRDINFMYMNDVQQHNAVCTIASFSFCVFSTRWRFLAYELKHVALRPYNIKQEFVCNGRLLPSRLKHVALRPYNIKQ